MAAQAALAALLPVESEPQNTLAVTVAVVLAMAVQVALRVREAMAALAAVQDRPI